MLTLPNLLTLSRIFAVPILVFLLWRPTPIDYAITFALYCLVGATDYFDGYLARTQGKISRMGQFLDPIADKIMVAAVLVSKLAKWKTTFQLVALGALILSGALPTQGWVHDVGLISLWAAAALTLITGYDYLKLGLKHLD